ncbi:MAG: NAD(P)-binding domain-containing protein, partial [Anaerolineae bacterium]|nr:NAD(P)-binding domain-containing protein [Anaerolineae bacterium]
MTQPIIGFIGLGIMGRPMAGHLLRAGYSLIVHDLNRQAVAALVAAGAAEAFSPKEVAARSDVIITMLPDSPDVEAVALGADGLIEGIRPGTLYADMSTIAPTMAVKVANTLAAQGARCLDAPVSGGEVGAINATLSIMVGGAAADFVAMRPIFAKLGKTITLCGPNGAGQIVKACNQIQVALNIIGMAEALVLGAKAGVNVVV